MPPFIVFRTDASLDIGTGHVMRCLTLADAMSERGALCRFVCRSHPGNLVGLIRERGYEVSELAWQPGQGEFGPGTLAHAGWLGTSRETDAAQTRAALGSYRCTWLVVDHYAIDERWERILRDRCLHLMVIDDIADRGHDCDVLLDQNLGRTVADYAPLVPDDCTVLAGPGYSLLRPEFAALRSYSLARREDGMLRRLLITMGGVDRDNATGKVLDALRQCAMPADCKVTVVMGPHAPWLEQVRRQAATMPGAVEVLVNVSNMAQLMADSDLAVGAAGSTSWERCALGLPTILLVLAENQERIASALQAAGAVMTTQVSTIDRDLKAFFADPDRLAQDISRQSHAARMITSGAGAGLVAARILEGREV